MPAVEKHTLSLDFLFVHDTIELIGSGPPRVWQQRLLCEGEDKLQDIQGGLLSENITYIIDKHCKQMVHTQSVNCCCSQVYA